MLPGVKWLLTSCPVMASMAATGAGIKLSYNYKNQQTKNKHLFLSYLFVLKKILSRSQLTAFLLISWVRDNHVLTSKLMSAMKNRIIRIKS